ncbi:MAG: response regulator [Pseudomonadota bacterium]
MTAFGVVQNRPITLLLVDDDDVDIMSICRALSAKGIENPLVVAHDGIEALECLRGENGRDQVQPPFIILLDLNMPRMDGIEFLGELRADPALQNSVVYVLTTSSAQKDKVQAHAHDVDGFITKGASQDVVNDVIDLLSL